MKNKIKTFLARLYLQLGRHFLIKGVHFYPGQEIPLKKRVQNGFKGSKVKRGSSTVFVKNVYFNFVLNKIVYTYSDKPVKITPIKQLGKV